MSVEPYYSKKRTCELLGDISETTLWRLEKKGFIESYPMGSRRVYSESEIKRCQGHVKQGEAIVLEETPTERAAA